MTTQDLMKVAVPYARHALIEARPAVINAVGRAGWVVLWPAWAVVTGPLLPLLVRIGIELAVGMLAPKLLPTLELINAVSVYISETFLPGSSRAFLADLTWLLKTPRSDMIEPVRATLDVPPGALALAAGGEAV